jgi:23S rRNA U2552 (ribose-2'-O)-methylase RlmE/FtsJ
MSESLPAADARSAALASALAVESGQNFQVGTAATCGLCGVVGHRTVRCVAHLIPDVVLALPSNKKHRMEELCRRWKRDAAAPASASAASSTPGPTPADEPLDSIPGVGLDVLPSPREAELVFLRTPTPTRLVRAFQHSELLNRHFDSLFITKHQAKSPEEMSEKLVQLCEEWQKQYDASGAKPSPPQAELIASLTAKVAATTAAAAASSASSSDLASTAGAPFSCILRMQSYPKSMRPALLSALSPRILMSPRDFTHVLFVVHTYGKYFFSLEPAELYVLPAHQVASQQQSPPVGKQPAAPGQSLAASSASNAEILSRAFYKMEESFLMDDALRTRITPGCRAIDLGASPGGWSSYLATARECHVLAIDPGVVLCTSERVQHVCKLVEESAAEIRAFVTREQPLDLIVCDMNVRPELACELIHFVCATAPISPTAMLVLTCKETLTGRSKKLVTEAQIGLSDLFADWRSYHLLANGKERTLIGQYRDMTPEAREAFRVERATAEATRKAEWEVTLAAKKAAEAEEEKATGKVSQRTPKVGKKAQKKAAAAAKEGEEAAAAAGASSVAAEP